MSLVNGASVTVGGSQSLTTDSITIDSTSTLNLDGSAGAVKLSVNSGSTVANNGSLVVTDDTNTVTLQGTGGDIIFTGSDIGFITGKLLFPLLQSH